MIKAYSDGDGYVLRDSEGTTYGRYSKKKEAEQNADDWNNYYAAPLAFTVTGSM